MSSDWKFNDSIVPIFDEHVRKSVPMYEEIHRMITDIAGWFIEDGTTVYVGGFPCTPFSFAGKGEGTNDKKSGDLGYQFFRIVKENQPKAFIVENVKGIISKKHRKFFDSLIANFTEAGYNVSWKVINCFDYGVAQLRERVFVIGIRNDIGFSYEFPKPVTDNERKVLRDVIGDLPEPDQKIFLGGAFNSGGEKTGFLRKVSFDKPAWTITSNMNGKNNAQIVDNHDKYYNGGFSSRYTSRNRQKQWDEPSFTIVSCARQLPLHPEPPNYDIRKIDEYDVPPPRRFTVRECLRIQSVPDWFSFSEDIPLTKQYERCSGIPSLVAYKLGNALAEQLNVVSHLDESEAV
ncbi:DNA cytosine methyltransferase [Bacillus sp. EE-W1]|uniref:DNA cytosine methyltransferase n=1 Tax=Bacillus sp. EE-W1 TaxID=2662453 RepID=UPI001892AAEA|nr:DNA (cytosine-5-)-methyltransferase [Bacillus sp. EE-W1]